jgi:hypothetical protein
LLQQVGISKSISSDILCKDLSVLHIRLSWARYGCNIDKTDATVPKIELPQWSGTLFQAEIAMNHDMRPCVLLLNESVTHLNAELNCKQQTKKNTLKDADTSALERS